MKGIPMVKAPREAPEVTVVVCTFNRAAILKLCLESLVTQRTSPSHFEIIVVDNNSSDDTKEVVSSFLGRAGNIRYVLETNQGLSHARNRGYREAAAGYVGYIDDDAKAPEDWVAKAMEIIRGHGPDVFGGSIYPFYLTEKPEWFDDKYEVRVHHEKTGWIPEDSKRFLSGSNVFFRKSLLEEYSGFKPELGMSGTEIGYGEETEIIVRALKEHRKVYHSRDLVVLHLVPEHKMQLWFHIYSNYRWGKDNVTLRQLKYESGAVLELAGMIDSVLKGINQYIHAPEKRSVPYLEQFILQEYAGTIREIGRRLGYLMKVDESAELRSMLKVSPGGSFIGLSEYLALNLKLLRRTKAARMLIGLIRGRRK
jgi:glucosyl-dolichyl phosphate glucuronosyltransferase